MTTVPRPHRDRTAFDEFPGWFDNDPASLRRNKLADQEFGQNSNPRPIDGADAMLQRDVPISNINLKFFFFPSYNAKSWAKTKKRTILRVLASTLISARFVLDSRLPAPWALKSPPPLSCQCAGVSRRKKQQLRKQRPVVKAAAAGHEVLEIRTSTSCTYPFNVIFRAFQEDAARRTEIRIKGL